jgi:gas vesicle protein
MRRIFALARTLHWLPRTTTDATKENIIMSTTLNDTLSAAKQILASANTEATHAVGTAKNAMDSARDGADHAVSSARTTWLDGVKAVTGMVAMIRGLQADDALGWVGLSRRRSPVAAIGIFSAGMVLGAGAALLFAPMSGEETRKRILGGFSGVKGEVKSDAAAVGHKVEEIASQAKDAVIKAEHKVEDSAVALKDMAASKVDAAVNAAKSAVGTASNHDTSKPAVTENGNGKSKSSHVS